MFGKFSIYIYVFASFVLPVSMADATTLPALTATAPVSVAANVASYNCIQYFNGTSSQGCKDSGVKYLPGVPALSVVGSAETSYDLSAAPEISAWSTVSSDSFSSSSTISWAAHASGAITLTYGIDVIGPGPSVLVPVRVVAKLMTEVSGGLYRRSQGAAMASANLLIGPVEDHTVGDALQEGISHYYPMGQNVGKQTQVLTIDKWINLYSDVAYQVQMNAFSKSEVIWQIYDRLAIEGDFASKAFVDPFFEIDPDFAAQGYRLAFSNGINNVLPGSPPSPAPVPLPAAGALLAAALVGLAGLRRRRDSRSR